MAYNYVTKDNMGAMLDQAIVQGLITSDLETPNVDWFNGGKTFTLRSISTSGFQPHTRDAGWNAGEITDEKTEFTLTQDRDIEFYVDQQDVDETNQELSVANISKVFYDEHVIPEIDAYRFSRMAKYAQDNSSKVGNYKPEDLDSSTIYSALKDGLKKMRKYGPANVIGYVSTDMMDALERSKEFTRSITNQNVGTTALDSRVTSVDGVVLKEVYATDRFASKFDFSNGFTKAADAVNLNFVLAVNGGEKPAVIAKLKEQAVYLFAPGQHTKGDGYLYQNRLYHDLFVQPKMVDGVYVSAATAAK